MTLPPTAPRKVAVHFARLGPYHLARLRTATSLIAPHGWELIGLETAAQDLTYSWRYERDSTPFERHTVFPQAAAEALPESVLRRGMTAALTRLNPQAVAIAGWATPDARACRVWCRRHGVPAILMSDTRAADGNRVWWKEAIKRQFLNDFDAALVAGRSHRDYLVSLGFPAERIAFGFDVVDNAYFRTACRDEQGQHTSPRRAYLLASNRFLPRKNLTALLRAFAVYRQATAGKALRVWDLCLLGNGPEQHALQQEAARLGIWIHAGCPWDPNRPLQATPGVLLPGFRQIDELPRFYANALAFIHPALSEPWGLVINEAMASGLPILSSLNVGAAEELLVPGLNGICFDPHSVEAMAAAMIDLASFSTARLQEMGKASGVLIEERCPTSAFGEGLHQLLNLPPR